MPSNYRLFVLGGIAFACGIGFAFIEKGWIGGILATVSIACLIGFITLSIARVQNVNETPEQAARRREVTADKFDPDP